MQRPHKRGRSRDGEPQHSDDDDCHSEGSSQGDGRRVGFRARSPESEMASLVSRALVGDLQLGTVHTTAPPSEETIRTTAIKEKTCCVCSGAALYTCPGCGRRTCSMTCVRVHKESHNCTGSRNVTDKISLSDFTDLQLQRDYRFLENCRRVVDNADRLLPPARRYNFKALPPPLRALREAARRRGVVCQLMSDGMSKREANTSRYDRAANVIQWHCQFNFHCTSGSGFTVSTKWGNERHYLGDVARFCWATNPALPCHPIKLTYNSAPRRPAPVNEKSDTGERHEAQHEVSGSAASDEDGCAGDAGSDASTTGSSADNASHSHGADLADEDRSEHDDDGELSEVGVAEDPHAEPTPHGVDGERPQDSDDSERACPPATPSANVAAEQAGQSTADAETGSLTQHHSNPLAPVEDTETVTTPAEVPNVSPISPEEVRNEALVRDFLGAGECAILSRAERLGSAERYFRLDTTETLNETLRTLFFINEYPVFDVIHLEDLHKYTLVTAADVEAIRVSFRPKERTPEELLRRRHPGLKLKSDMEPEEAERLSAVPCRMNLQNRCVAGDNCPYWHCTVDQWPQCRAFAKTGRCSLGYRCSFRHGTSLPGDAPPGGGVGPRGHARGRGHGYGRGSSSARGRGRGRGFGGGGRGRGRRFP